MKAKIGKMGMDEEIGIGGDGGDCAWFGFWGGVYLRQEMGGL